MIWPKPLPLNYRTKIPWSCVINGGIIVTGKLLPRLKIPLTLDSIHACRYRNQTSGKRHCTGCINRQRPLQGRTVLIVDDILDEGHTLKAIGDYCLEQGASCVIQRRITGQKTANTANPSPPISSVWMWKTIICSATAWITKVILRNAAGIYA